MRRPLGFILCVLILLGVYNSGPRIRECRALWDSIHEHRFRLTPASALLSARSYFADAGDARRYFAYCNAALGRARESYFVRDLQRWQAEFVNPPTNFEPEKWPTLVEAPRLPYRDYVVEYPPGFFLWTLPVALLTEDGDLFRVLFCSLMALALLGAVGICARLGPWLPQPVQRERLWSLAAVAFAALGVVTTHRYDAVIALLLCAVCAATLQGRPFLAGAALGVAVASKLVPVLVAPVLVLYLWTSRRQRELLPALAGTLMASALLLVPSLLLAGAPLLDMVRYHGQRPIQIESSAASLLWLWHVIDGSTLEMARTYGSSNLLSPHAAALQRLVPGIAGAVALCLCYGTLWQRLRAPQDERQRALTALIGVMAVLLLYMLTGKVFSPQYLVWVLPLGVLTGLYLRAWQRWSFLAVLALSQLIFPVFYNHLEDLHPLALALVFLRNAALVVFTVCLLADPQRARGTSSRQTP